jgi:hypothetical protein
MISGTRSADNGSACMVFREKRQAVRLNTEEPWGSSLISLSEMLGATGILAVFQCAFWGRGLGSERTFSSDIVMPCRVCQK